MMDRDDSVVVTGIVHDSRVTVMTFSFSYLYLLSKRGFVFTEHSADANTLNITMMLFLF